MNNSKKQKKARLVIVIESVLLAILIAAAVIVAVNLRAVELATQDGASLKGWSWGGRLYISADAFIDGMDISLNRENLTLSYSEPVNPEQVKADAEEALTLQFNAQSKEEKEKYEEKLAGLEAEIAGLEEKVETLQAQIDELEEAAQKDAEKTVPVNNSNIAKNSQSNTGAQTQSPPATSGVEQAPQPTPAPTPTQAPPTQGVDAATCIAEARAYALGKGMTEDGSLTTANAGFLNPPDITQLSQDGVIGDLKYCIDVYATYSPDDPSLVRFNIVQGGNLIYALYG